MSRLVLLCIAVGALALQGAYAQSGGSGDSSGSDSSSDDDYSGSGSDSDESGSATIENTNTVGLVTIPIVQSSSTSRTSTRRTVVNVQPTFTPSTQVLRIFFDGSLDLLTNNDKEDLKSQVKNEVILRSSSTLSEEDILVTLSSGSIVAEVQFAEGTPTSQISGLASSIEATPMTATVGGVALRSTGASVRSTASSTPAPSVDDDDDDLSDGAIVGIVIAVVVVVAIFCYAVNFYEKSEEKLKLQEKNSEYTLRFVPNKENNSVARMGDDGLLYVYTGVTQMSEV
eukprot:m.467341 g.467341  ORF g.467341 m.467341 type:complete len:285 (-) comp21637_c0_seq5:375-1229(-)